MRLLALALLAHPPPAAEGQWPGIDHAWALPSAGKWFEWSTGARLLTDSLLGDADALLAARRAAVAELRTEADWARRRADVRGKFAQIFGRSSAEGAAERAQHSPLNPKITKRTVHPELNATVEMLYFESRPGFFVTAGLWLPAEDAPGKDPLTGKRAGILFASGHSCQAWRRLDEPDYFDYHFLLLQLVRKGFVVLAYDPPGQGERLFYTNGVSAAAPFASSFEASKKRLYRPARWRARARPATGAAWSAAAPGTSTRGWTCRGAGAPRTSTATSAGSCS